jgi:hypothetical protein
MEEQKPLPALNLKNRIAEKSVRRFIERLPVLSAKKLFAKQIKSEAFPLCLRVFVANPFFANLSAYGGAKNLPSFFYTKCLPALSAKKPLPKKQNLCISSY